MEPVAMDGRLYIQRRAVLSQPAVSCVLFFCFFYMKTMRNFFGCCKDVWI